MNDVFMSYDYNNVLNVTVNPELIAAANELIAKVRANDPPRNSRGQRLAGDLYFELIDAHGK